MEDHFKPDIILHDVNALGYAAMYAPGISALNHNGFSTAALHGALSSILALLKERPGAVPFVLWDARAQWRYEACPEYKSGRNDKPEKIAIKEAYKAQAPYIRLLLSACGIPQVTCADAEADDLAGRICRNMDPSWKIELHTSDTDWWQALDEHVVWCSSSTKNRVSLKTLSDPENDLEEGYFTTPQEYISAKALAGDKSDNIPGIEKVGLRTASKIIREFGGIEAFWSGVDAGTIKPNGSIQKRVASQESRDLYQRNLYIMDWTMAPEPDLASMAVTAYDPDPDEVVSIAETFGLKKIQGMVRSLWFDRLPEMPAMRQAIAAVHSSLQPNEYPSLPRPY
jgi:5'-3' exonuclease